MWCYAVLVDREELDATVAELSERVNSSFRRQQPFFILTEEEEISKTMAGKITRFRLAIAPDYSPKNEKESAKFLAAVEDARIALKKMNDLNYVLMPHPKMGVKKNV